MDFCRSARFTQACGIEFFNFVVVFRAAAGRVSHSFSKGPGGGGYSRFFELGWFRGSVAVAFSPPQFARFACKRNVFCFAPRRVRRHCRRDQNRTGPIMGRLRLYPERVLTPAERVKRFRDRQRGLPVPEPPRVNDARPRPGRGHGGRRRAAGDGRGPRQRNMSQAGTSFRRAGAGLPRRGAGHATAVAVRSARADRVKWPCDGWRGLIQNLCPEPGHRFSRANEAGAHQRDTLRLDMSGPPPTPLHFRILRGNPGKRALRPEPEPPALAACPEPPAFITGYAAEEWRRAAPDLHVIGLLRGVDVMLLAAYCQHVATWRTAVEALARNPGLLVKSADGARRNPLVKSADGARRNPLIKIAADASLAMLRFANEFGMGAAARSRIAAGWTPPDETPDRWRGLLA
jgi:P27 family predicted phage terminase small subunit